MSEAVPAGHREKRTSHFAATAIEAVGDAAAIATIIGAVYALAFGGSWRPALEAAATYLAAGAALKIWGMFLRRKIRQIQEEISRKRAEILHEQLLTSQLRAEASRLRAELAVKQTHASQLRAELAEQERLLRQKETQIDQRVAAEKAAEAIILTNQTKANQLEILARQVELRAGQLEIRMEQSRLWKSLAESEEAAEDRIMEAYAQGFVSGKRGDSFQFGRHLRIVHSSA